jgi:hypothetical protein
VAGGVWGRRGRYGLARKANGSGGGVVTYATWNPSDKGSNVTLSNGNLTTSIQANGQEIVASTVTTTSGKWYWEIHFDSTPVGGSTPFFGIATVAVGGITGALGSTLTTWAYRGDTGNKFNNNNANAYGSTLAAGDTVGIALDASGGKVWFAKNGTWQASGDPSAGTNAAYTGLSGTFRAGISGDGSFNNPIVATANFGASAFAFTPPTGFNSGLYS